MKIARIEEEKLIFDDGLEMESYHYRSCCEVHWADFLTLENYNIDPKTGDSIDIMDVEFPDDIVNNIELIKGEGFNLIASNGAKFFVPCYADNNGYYDTNLHLKIEGGKNDEYMIIDLNEFQKPGYHKGIMEKRKNK